MRPPRGAALAIVLCAAGCPKPLHDPFEEDRAALARLREIPLPADWPAEATAVIHPDVVEAELTAALTTAVEAPTEVFTTRFLGANLEIAPNMAMSGLRVGASAACGSCLEVGVSALGEVKVVLSDATSRSEHHVAWTGRATGVFEITVGEDRLGRRQIQGAVAAGSAWRVDIDVDKLPLGANKAVAGLLSNQLQKIIGSGAIPPVALAALGGGGPVGLRDLRVRPLEAGVAIDLAFYALNPGTLSVDAFPEDPAMDRAWAWALSAPEATLLAVARAAAVDLKAKAGFRVEPIGLGVKDQTFELDLRFWRERGRKPAYEARVFGTIRLDGGQLVFDAERAEALTRGLRGDPLVILFQGRLLDALVNSVSAAVPSSQAVEVGTTQVTVQVGLVGATAGTLHLHGDFESSTPKRESGATP